MIEIELKELIEKKFGNVKAFSQTIDLPYTTVRSILQRGIMNSNVDNVIRMSEGLGFKAEELIKLKRRNTINFDEKQEIIDNTTNVMEKLELQNVKKVYKFAEHQLETQESDSEDNIIEFPGGRWSAAGSPLNGESQDGELSVMLINAKEIPNNADEIVTIAGDSMEPTLEKGQQVFIHYQPIVEHGEIAIVSIEDEGVTCKRVYFNDADGEVILESDNDEYEDMVLPADQVRIIGKVLGQ